MKNLPQAQDFHANGEEMNAWFRNSDGHNQSF